MLILLKLIQKIEEEKGAPGWLSQLSVHHDLTAHEFEPHNRLSAVSTEPSSDTLSPSLSLCPSPAHSLSLPKYINKLKKKGGGEKRKENL